MSPKELLCEVENTCSGYPLLVLTDINSTSGCLYHALECQSRGWPVIMGVDFRDGPDQKFIVIAQNNEGFQNTNFYLSEVLHKNTKLEDNAPVLPYTYIIYPFKNIPERPLRSNEYVGINHTELFAFQQHKKQEPLSQQHKYLSLNPVTFRNKRDFNAHRLLRAIDKNTLLSKLPKEEQGELHHSFYSEEKLRDLYSDYEFLLHNTQNILSQCSLHFDFNDKSKLANKKTFTQTKNRDNELLDQLVKEGLEYRYANGVSQEVKDRVAKELVVIKQCDFVPYFLINHNIVSYARRRGYFYVGRGSGANSLVAYLLRITNVDPIVLGF